MFVCLSRCTAIHWQKTRKTRGKAQGQKSKTGNSKLNVDILKNMYFIFLFYLN